MIFLFQGKLFAEKRSEADQAAVDEKTEALTLYHFDSCRFCRKVRRSINRKSLNIELKDIRLNKNYETELMSGGGKTQVPTLRIVKPSGEIKWMYESGDIIKYLGREFNQ